MVWSTETWVTVVFYALVISLLIIYRKKFEFQGKIIALRRLKFGIPFMQKLADKHKETLKILGYIGIGVGFLGMLFMLYTLVDAFVNIFLDPNAPAAVAPLVPGVNVPGSPLKIPLWVIIPLFFVVLIHEAGHGLVAKAHKIPIVSTGIVFFGPIAGAFVEPDEKKLKKASDVVKFSVFSAGPFFNALTAGVVFLLMLLIINPLGNSMTEIDGFTVSSVQEDYPAMLAGMQPNVIYTSINGQEINSTQSLLFQLGGLYPGRDITIGNETDVIVITPVAHEEDPSRGYLGVTNVHVHVVRKASVSPIIFGLMQIITQFFFWIFVLSIGLGAFNLLPLGPVDGGQMSRLAFTRMYGEKKGLLVWGRISIFLLLTLIILLVVPILRNIL